LPEVDIVISLTHTDQHYAQIIDALAPQGQLALIDDPATLDAVPLKRKSISLHWELMFTRSLFQTADMIRQHELLQRVAQLIDEACCAPPRASITAHQCRESAPRPCAAGAGRGRSCWKGLPAKPGGPLSGRSVAGSPLPPVGLPVRARPHSCRLCISFF
jgi:hypothetical protein